MPNPPDPQSAGGEAARAKERERQLQALKVKTIDAVATEMVEKVAATGVIVTVCGRGAGRHGGAGQTFPVSEAAASLARDRSSAGLRAATAQARPTGPSACRS